MKAFLYPCFKGLLSLFFLLVFQFQMEARHFVGLTNDSTSFKEFKGSILDEKTKKELAFASIQISGTTIATISNSEGEFSIKIPQDFLHSNLIISFLGYDSRVVPIEGLNPTKNTIFLNPGTILLEEVVVEIRDAKNIFLEVMKNRKKNYGDNPIQMTGFYRETIRKRRNYVSLSESVLEIEKQPFSINRNDEVNLFKGRKKADYSKLDTLNFKLQGGPFSALYVDLIKNSDFIFSDEVLDFYEFTLDEISQINDEKVLVVAFKQKNSLSDPLYYGKLYIDANSYAIISANFHLNVEDRVKAGLLFTRKKPFGVVVYPTEVSYQLKYRKQNDQWVFAYSRGDLSFKLNWDKKLLNTVYHTTLELAVTYWKNQDIGQSIPKENLRSNVIMSEKVSNYSDPNFWGEYNIIEPEKSIESAIRKIQSLKD